MGGEIQRPSQARLETIYWYFASVQDYRRYVREYTRIRNSNLPLVKQLYLLKFSAMAMIRWVAGFSDIYMTRHETRFLTGHLAYHHSNLSDNAV